MISRRLGADIMVFTRDFIIVSRYFEQDLVVFLIFLLAKNYAVDCASCSVLFFIVCIYLSFITSSAKGFF